MRIPFAGKTLRVQLYQRAGWLTLSIDRLGDGWAKLRNFELLPVGAELRAHARVRRACTRRGHLWRNAKLPEPGEARDPSETVHRKYRCADCGTRSAMPKPARAGSARPSDA